MDIRSPNHSQFSVSPCLRGAIFAVVLVSSFFANAQSSKPLDGQPWDFGCMG